MSSFNDYLAEVVTFGPEKLVFLRIVPNGEGLSPTWYSHNGTDFVHLEEHRVHEAEYKLKTKEQ
jgi:hypothetical protein|tara:strand:+ start:416 stop:607 length:192 start_codon:yes stop_codon:yes gene_type:complete